MKIGYSILLGEHIDAAMLDRSDVRDFQVVCPNCKEPLFKMVRQDKGEERHFLSHYEKAHAFEADCELRVAGYQPDAIAKSDAVSRDQKIEYFLSVIQDAARNATGIFTHADGGEGAIQRTLESKRFMLFWKDYRQAIAKHKDMMIGDFEELADEWQKSEVETRTTFGRDIQMRIARDVMNHLLSSNAAPSFYHLAACATLYVIATIEARQRNNDLTEQAGHMGHLAIALVMPETMSDSQYQREGTRIYRHPMVVEPMEAHSKLASEVYSQMIGILMRIPYFELLKASTAKSTPN